MRRLLVFALILAIGHLPYAINISLAKESGEGRPVGSLGGAVHADPFTGVATTSIPIEVPPGRNGMQPSLALTYNSAAGNGWLGMGWDLESEGIYRQTKWGVDYSKNTDAIGGKAFVVKMSGVSGDLVQTPSPAPSNQWSANIEGGVSRIEKLTAGDGQIMWKVTTKQGRKYFFGQTTASRQYQMTPLAADKIFGWLLDRVEDLDGNYMTYSYLPDTTNNQVYLDHIDYAGNGATAPINTIKFWLELLPSDIPAAVMSTSNYPVVTARRLRTIEIKANGSYVRAYKLQYERSLNTFRSLLSSIQSFGKDGLVSQVDGTVSGGTAQPPTSVTYNSLSSAGTFVPIPYQVVVANGYGTGWSCSPADVDGDGDADVLCTYIGTGNGWHQAVARSNGDGTFAPFQYQIIVANGYGTGWSCGPADVNGDTKADVVCSYIGTGSGWHQAVARSNGDGTFAPFQYQIIVANGYGTGWSCGPADVNGDSKADVVCSYIGMGSGWHQAVARSNGDGTFAPFQYQIFDTNGYGAGWRCGFADVNGDGKTDTLCTYIGMGGGWNSAGALALGGNDNANIFNTGMGGATTITYAPSTQWPNTRLPFSVQRVKSITTCDNWDSVNKVCPVTANASTTAYNYSGGFYHFGERDLRGVNYVKVAGQAAANGDQTITETWFHQGSRVDAVAETVTELQADTVASTKGLPFRTKVTDQTGKIYSDSTSTYVADADGVAPWFTPVAQVTTAIENNTKTTQVLYPITTGYSPAYDMYGNVMQVQNLGDLSTPTDDTTTVVTFNNYDTTNWLVAFPTVTTTYAGLGTGGTKLSETLTSYDGVSSCTAPAGNLVPTKGHVTKIERYLQGGTNPVSGMEYNAFGGLTCTRDPKGNKTTIAYDPTGSFPLTSTNALGHVTTTSYYGVNGVVMDTGLYGQAKNVTDPNGKTTGNTYDALGRKLTTTTPDGLVQTMAYNYGGAFIVGTQHIQSIMSGGGLTTNLVSKTYFDGLGRTTRKESPGAADGGANLKVLVTETQYDVRGLTAKTSLPYIQNGGATATSLGLWRTMTYDAVGRMTQTTNPDNTSSQVCYSGWTTTSLDPKLHKKVETKDALGRLVTVQEYSGTATTGTCAGGTLYATTTYSYDLRGNLLSVTDTKGNVSTMTYDTLNRKLTMHDSDMGNWSYTYDANGNLLTQVDAKNQKLCFTYDAVNRRTQKNYGTTTVACGTNTVVYAYDDAVAANNGKGRLKQVTDPAQSVTFQYDSRGRISQSAKTLDGTTYTTTSAYDGLGRLTTVNYPTTPIKTVTYTYDGPQLKSVLEGATTYVTYGGWNALGQPATSTFGNGVVTTNTYADLNNLTCSTPKSFRLCTLKTQKGTNPLYQDLRYDYEDNGNVGNIYDSTVAGNAGDQHFAYDWLDRLTVANGPYGASGANASLTYGYDEIGNLTLNSQLSASPYVYPASGSSSVRPHAVTTAGANSYSYDANGNLLTGAGRTYTWNQENKPLTIVQGGTTTTFVYDGDGGRVKKLVGTTTTRYLSKLYECDNTNCSRFVWAGSTRIATIASNGTVNYWHGDHLGSSSVITDSTGNKVETITYYPFGGTRSNTSPSIPAIDVPYKYTGKELDASTGLYYYEARYYDATLARFISADTVVANPRNPQSLNRYSYVENNPLRYTDPTGHFKINVGKFLRRGLGDLGTTIVGIAGQALFSWAGGYSWGTAMLTQSKSGRYVLAGEIVAGTAIVSWYCGGCATVASTGIFQSVPVVAGSALLGEVGVGTLGGISAAKSGGDISKGVLFGTVAGGLGGAANGALGGAIPLDSLQWSVGSLGPIATAGALNVGGGAVFNAAAGAAIGYAGGRGNLNTISAAAVRSMKAGLTSDIATSALGLAWGVGPEQPILWEPSAIGSFENTVVAPVKIPGDVVSSVSGFFKFVGGNTPQWDELGDQGLRRELQSR